MREIGHIAESAAGGVGVKIQVAVCVPGERVVIAAAVVEPGRVVAVRDSVGRISTGVFGCEVKLDLGVDSVFTVGARKGEEVLIEDFDLTLNHGLSDVSGCTAGVANDVYDDGYEQPAEGGVISRRWVREVVGAVARGAAARGGRVVFVNDGAASIAVFLKVVGLEIGLPRVEYQIAREDRAVIRLDGQGRTVGAFGVR